MTVLQFSVGAETGIAIAGGAPAGSRCFGRSIESTQIVSIPCRQLTFTHIATFVDGLETETGLMHIRRMRKSDIICPKCSAGYRRVELTSRGGSKGEFRCLLCDHVLETFDGTTDVAIRLTVQPEKTFQGIDL